MTDVFQEVRTVTDHLRDYCNKYYHPEPCVECPFRKLDIGDCPYEMALTLESFLKGAKEIGEHHET